jgi:hypothetical protein
MAVPVVNIEVEQGADYASTFTITNPDGSVYALDSSVAYATVKKFPSSTTSYSFSTSLTVATGKITVSLASSITASMEPGRYYYDVVVVKNSSGLRTRVIEGMLLLTPGITLPS